MQYRFPIHRANIYPKWNENRQLCYFYWFITSVEHRFRDEQLSLALLVLLAVQPSFGPSPPLIFWSPNLFRHMVGLLGRVISPSQGLYLHRTTQHRKTRTNIHALSGIRTRDPVYERSRPAPHTARPLDRHYYWLLEHNSATFKKFRIMSLIT
jgi:hypothetical protein